MELWKIHKYCESADLDELERAERRLNKLIEDGQDLQTNAAQALAIVGESLELKRLFD